jgi:hypothetical protein
LFAGSILKAQSNNDSVFDAGVILKTELLNVATNSPSSLREADNTRQLTLFVFLSPECPLCQNYSGRLNNFQKRYANDIAIYGIIPGRAYSADIIKKFILQYDIRFPLFIDANKKLTTYLHATVTPQVILLSNKNELVYKGAIDNWAVSLGQQRITTTQNFLDDALQQSLSDKIVLIKRTQAVGCRINDY